MVNSNTREGVCQDKALERLPRERPALAATVEPLVGNAPHLMDELHQSRDVERDAVVADMSAYFGAQQRPELLGRTSATGLFRPHVHRLELGTQSFAACLHLYQHTAPTGPPKLSASLGAEPAEEPGVVYDAGNGELAGAIKGLVATLNRGLRAGFTRAGVLAAALDRGIGAAANWSAPRVRWLGSSSNPGGLCR